MMSITTIGYMKVMKTQRCHKHIVAMMVEVTNRKKQYMKLTWTTSSMVVMMVLHTTVIAMITRKNLVVVSNI